RNDRARARRDEVALRVRVLRRSVSPGWSASADVWRSCMPEQTSLPEPPRSAQAQPRGAAEGARTEPPMVRGEPRREAPTAVAPRGTSLRHAPSWGRCRDRGVAAPEVAHRAPQHAGASWHDDGTHGRRAQAEMAAVLARAVAQRARLGRV